MKRGEAVTLVQASLWTSRCVCANCFCRFSKLHKKRLYRLSSLRTVHWRTKCNEDSRKFARVVNMLVWRRCAVRAFAVFSCFTSSRTFLYNRFYSLKSLRTHRVRAEGHTIGYTLLLFRSFVSSRSMRRLRLVMKALCSGSSLSGYVRVIAN